MKSKGRFQEARYLLAGSTVAVLLGTWSALTVHDIAARADTSSSSDSVAPATIDLSPITVPSQSLPSTTTNGVQRPSTSTTPRTAPQTTTHTRTRGS